MNNLSTTMNVIGELKDGKESFVVFKMDKYVTEVPDMHEYKEEYKCNDFVVYRRRLGVKRLYMIRKTLLRKLINVLSNVILVPERSTPLLLPAPTGN